MVTACDSTRPLQSTTPFLKIAHDSGRRTTQSMLNSNKLLHNTKHTYERHLVIQAGVKYRYDGKVSTHASLTSNSLHVLSVMSIIPNVDTTCQRKYVHLAGVICRSLRIRLAKLEPSHKVCFTIPRSN